MNEQHYQRIDKGIPKKQYKVRAHDLENQSRNQKGKYLPTIPESLKALILAEAPEKLRLGQSTDSIASEYGLNARTLRFFLLAEIPQEALQARSEWLASELIAQVDL